MSVCIINSPAGYLAQAVTRAMAAQGWIALCYDPEPTHATAGAAAGLPRGTKAGPPGDDAESFAAEAIRTAEERSQTEAVISVVAPVATDEVSRSPLYGSNFVPVTRAFLLAREAVRVMRTRGSGSLVTVVSAGCLAGQGTPANIAAAAAAVSMTQSIAMEVQARGITANVVATPLAPRGSVADGSSAAPAVLVTALLSPAARGITGEVFLFDGQELAIMGRSKAARSVLGGTAASQLDWLFRSQSGTARDARE